MLQQRYLYKAFVIICVAYSLPAHAQLSAAIRYKPVVKESALNIEPANLNENAGQASALVNNEVTDESSMQLVQSSAMDRRQERKKLMGYLKQVSANNADVSYNPSRAKIFYHLANVFASLRLYPLAMKCFFKTMEYKQLPGSKDLNIPSLSDSLSTHAVTTVSLNPGYLAVNAADDSLFVNSADLPHTRKHKDKKSKAITYQRITDNFNDGKIAAAYALLFHVKQPVPGKPKIFVFSNTGHTFITLIKYNTDSTSVSLSFGFYPKKDNLFSATPLDPTSSAVFKNDNDHQWDEVLGKFITKRKFEKILSLTRRYDGLEYHLAKNNCTDFAVQAASLAGINISKTTGSWPLGHGNNPAITGQSILAGNVSDTDTGNKTDLYMNFDDALGEVNP